MPVAPAAGRLAVSVAVCLLVVWWTAPALVAGQRASAGEYEVKAAMLYNLSHFVNWPASDPRRPVRLCILGRDPFGNSLTSGRPAPASVGSVTIRHLQGNDDVRSCQILYISSSERNAVPQIFETLKGSSVLTVGEMTQFAAHGGMIQFSLDDRRVRFEINPDAAVRAGLRISSKLLALATIAKNQE